MRMNDILQRRKYIKSLMDNGQWSSDLIHDTARIWHSSPPAIIMDVAVLSGNGRYYDKHSTEVQNIRAKKLGIEGKISKAEWDNKLKSFDGKCVNCGSDKDIVIDHIMPLSKGGANKIDNVQPLCRGCNSRKRDKII